ncbi:hypothetical protein REPUB_Repub11eG0083600 [Reevesia pubescens]
MLVKLLGAWVVRELCAPAGRAHLTKSGKLQVGKSAAGALSCKDCLQVSSSFDHQKLNVDSFTIWKMLFLYERKHFYLDTD